MLVTPNGGARNHLTTWQDRMPLADVSNTEWRDNNDNLHFWHAAMPLADVSNTERGIMA